MKKLIFSILPIIAIFSMSCDGRNRTYKSNTEVLRDSNLLKSFSEQLNFVPEKPIEIVTDTILSNGFQVKIKYTSIEDDFISLKKTSDNDSIINTNYKNFEAKIQIFKSGELISKLSLNKSKFSHFETFSFLEYAIMQFVWIDYNNLNANQISFNTSLNNLKNKGYKDYNITIDSKGIIEIKEINLISQAL